MSEHTVEMKTLILLFLIIKVNGIRYFSRNSNSKSSGQFENYRRLSGKRPALYTTGGYVGRESGSRNGFGLGLGNGIEIGYGNNNSGLEKPDLWNRSLEDYNLIHPLHCIGAFSTNFLTTEAQRNYFDIDEAPIVCGTSRRRILNQTNCYGELSIIEVHLPNVVPPIKGYEYVITKGCVDKTELENKLLEDDFVFNEKRNCWTSKVSDELAVADHLTSDIDFMNFINQNSSINLEIQVKKQSEICFCNGPLCNESPELKSLSFLFLISLILYAAPLV